MQKWSEVAQSCPILCDPMDCSLQGSSVHGIFQARVLEWLAISFSRRSWPRGWTWLSCIVGRHFTIWATREVHWWKKETWKENKWKNQNCMLLRSSPAVFSVQLSCSVVSDCLWSHGLQPARLPCPSPTSKACTLLSIESVMPSNHLILCRPLLLLPSIFLSIRVFSSESVLHIRWSEYWSFSFSISPSNEYSGLISFRIYLLSVQRTLKKSLVFSSNIQLY